MKINQFSLSETIPQSYDYLHLRYQSQVELHLDNLKAISRIIESILNHTHSQCESDTSSEFKIKNQSHQIYINSGQKI